MSRDDYIDFDPEAVSSDLCTVSAEQSGHARFVRHSKGESRFAEVKVIVTPHPGIHCYRFVWSPLAGSLPLPFMRAACFDGVKRALFEPLADGRRIAFVQVSIVDGSYHDQDTDEQSVQVAAFMAVQDALGRATLVSA